MKRINVFIMACMVLLSCTQIFAVTDTLRTGGKNAYWTESVKGANPSLQQNGYVYGTTTESDTLKNVASILVSQLLGVRAVTELPGQTKGHSRNKCSNTKFMVGINVNVAYTGGAATLVVQGSGDGINWTTVATASANLSSIITSTGTTWYVVDLTNIFLPYYRIAFNAGGATVNRVGRMQMLYILPQ
jgi:hypothetical protein